MVEEAYKNYSTGTVWDPPLWIPYSSMMIGAGLMILQYIAEIIKLIDIRIKLMDPLSIAIIVAVFTLIVLFSGIPIAFGLSFVSIALLLEGLQMLMFLLKHFMQV